MDTLATHSSGRLVVRPLLLRLAEVRRLVGLSKPTIYRLIAAGRFPKPVKLSKSAVAWKFDEVVAWTESLVRAREAELTDAA